MASTCRPSIFGIFRSQMSNWNGSASSIASARAPEAAVWISGRLGNCSRISRYMSSKSGSSSASRILGRLSITSCANRYVGIGANSSLKTRHIRFLQQQGLFPIGVEGEDLLDSALPAPGSKGCDWLKGDREAVPSARGGAAMGHPSSDETSPALVSSAPARCHPAESSPRCGIGAARTPVGAAMAQILRKTPPEAVQPQSKKMNRALTSTWGGPSPSTCPATGRCHAGAHAFGCLDLRQG